MSSFNLVIHYKGSLKSAKKLGLWSYSILGHMDNLGKYDPLTPFDNVFFLFTHVKLYIFRNCKIFYHLEDNTIAVVDKSSSKKLVHRQNVTFQDHEGETGI